MEAMWRGRGSGQRPALGARQGCGSCCGSSLSCGAWAAAANQAPDVVMPPQSPSSTRTKWGSHRNTGPHPAGNGQRASAPTLPHSRLHHVSPRTESSVMPLSGLPP